MSLRNVERWRDFRAAGETSILSARRTVLLNSSQSRRPCGADAWIRKSLEATTSLDPARDALISSVDLNTWETSLHLAQAHGRPRICLIASSDDEKFLRDCIRIETEFELDPALTCFLGFEPASSKRKERWRERDRLAITLAERVLPISVRPGGRMTGLLAELSGGREVDSGWRTDWKPSLRRSPIRLDWETIRTRFDAPLRGWLFHWTRAADGPWPGESKADYYSAVTSSGEEDARSAERTLERIVTEERLRASSWRLRGGERAVSFTSAPPGESGGLFRWRKRYARYTAEPFGIALHPDAALEAGVRAVVYMVEGDGRAESVPLHLQQGAGARGDWPGEHEHRHRGDFDLSRIPQEAWKSVKLPLDPSLGGE